MATFTVAGVALGGTGPVNGAEVSAWKASRFASPPAQGAAPPAGSPDAGPVTSGLSFGGVGAFAIAVPTAESYWLQVAYGGVNNWSLVRSVRFTDGTTGRAETLHNLLDDGSGNMTVGGVIRGAFGGGATAYFAASGGALHLRPHTSDDGFGFYGDGTGKWATLDGSAADRNVLDDGAGNMAVKGNVLSTANPTILGATVNAVVQIAAYQCRLTLAETAPGGLALTTHNSTGAVVNTLDDGAGNIIAAGAVSAGNGVFSPTNGAYVLLRPAGGSNVDGQFVVSTNGEAYNLDQNGARRNTLDDGNGNLTVKGSVTSSERFYQTADAFIFDDHAGNDFFAGYDTGAGAGATIYSIASAAPRNYLDDGNGNMSCAGALTVGGTVVAHGGIQSGTAAGGLSGILFHDRSGSQLWQWYGTGSRCLLNNGSGDTGFSIDPAGVVTAKGAKLNPITSGALPTLNFVSGTAQQVSAARDVFLVVPWTSPVSGTCQLIVALSPDNVTYSNVLTYNFVGLNPASTLPVSLPVPAGWYVRLTWNAGTLGACTYW
jgi:hypothetical protein